MRKHAEDISTMETQDVLTCIEKARDKTLDWATAHLRRVERIELVTPGLETHKVFSVWFFFDAESRLKEYETNGTVDELKDTFVRALKKQQCPAEYLKGIIFFTDTDENVKRFTSIQPIKTE